MKRTSFLHWKSFALAVVIGGGSVAIGTTTAVAEDIQVPIGNQAPDKQALQRPPTGMQSEKVREIYGEPLDWKEPVGDPPISSWEYQDFVVYFEYNHVIHTVLKYRGETAAVSN